MGKSVRHFHLDPQGQLLPFFLTFNGGSSRHSGVVGNAVREVTSCKDGLVDHPRPIHHWMARCVRSIGKPSRSAGAGACYLEIGDLNYKREVEGIKDKRSPPRGRGRENFAICALR